MPRQTIAKSTGVGSYPTLPLVANSADLTLTAADAVNKSQATFGSAGALLVFAINTHATDAQDVTIESAPDTLNREGDITDYSIAAGEVFWFIARRNGWRQADGMLYFDASNAAVKFGVIEV